MQRDSGGEEEEIVREEGRRQGTGEKKEKRERELYIFVLYS